MSCIARTGTIKELGGKAFALARLDAAELPIPAWFAITPAAFTRSITAMQQQALESGHIDGVRDALASLEPASDVASEIAASLKTLALNGAARFAVRSSAVDEDGAESSFAGQLATYLFVDELSVVRRVQDVWRSGFTEQIFEYRRQRGLNPAPEGAPAVVVQRMIDADVSGVAFSADPVSGRRGLAVVSAVRGIGTSLVGGEADADVYHVDRNGKIESQTIGHKQLRHGFDESAEEGVSAQFVPAEDIDSPALSAQQVLAVAALARRAAAHFGQPQDIEWAIHQDSLYLLQSRPITTLRNLPDPDGVLNIWDNSNITESYNGITTPLTFSFARSVYEGVYRQFCRILRVPESKVEASDRTFRCMLGLVQGRIYYNLLNWYRVLALLPGFTANRQFMEQMMGVRESLPESIAAGLDQASAAQRYADYFYLASMLVALVANLLTLRRQVERFYARLNDALMDTDPPLTEMRLDELMAHYAALEEKLLAHWDAPLVNDFFAMIFHGLLRKLTQKWCGDQDGMIANDAIRGQGGMISAEPAARLRHMAAIAATDAAFIEDLCNAPIDIALHAVRRHPEFRNSYEEYLAKFGDRCLEELKLESETLHENPQVLLRSVGELARVPRAPQDKPVSSGTSTDAVKKMRATLRGSPLRWMVLAWVLQNARSMVLERENLRFERTRLFGRVRRIFREAGKRLHASGALDQADDVFYLQVEEIRGYADGNAVTSDLKPLVALRQAEFERYRKSEGAPPRFETHGPVCDLQSIQAKSAPSSTGQDGDERRGIGCCPGTVRGNVRVVRDPRSAQLPAGFILVADHTDPGWIMLFPSAKGLLVERGSLLSHSAIVARELGIPAVVSIPGLLDWLRDGDEVELDGARGTVRRILAEVPHA